MKGSDCSPVKAEKKQPPSPGVGAREPEDLQFALIDFASLLKELLELLGRCKGII